MTDPGIFQQKLLDWYRREARVLPWRSDPSPYKVWISEMMLQQTRVDTVIPYFVRFVAEIPSVGELCETPDDRLLKLWQGLGYYRRAMNLKKAARIMMERFDGRSAGHGRDAEDIARNRRLLRRRHRLHRLRRQNLRGRRECPTRNGPPHCGFRQYRRSVGKNDD